MYIGILFHYADPVVKVMYIIMEYNYFHLFVNYVPFTFDYNDIAMSTFK